MVANKDNPNNHTCLTPWSLIHFISGFFLVILNIFTFNSNNFWAIFVIGNILHLIYEIRDYAMTKSKKLRKRVENKLNKVFSENVTESLITWSITNTIVNCICDQIVFALGICAGFYLFYVKKLNHLVRPLMVLSIILYIIYITIGEDTLK